MSSYAVRTRFVNRNYSEYVWILVMDVDMMAQALQEMAVWRIWEGLLLSCHVFGTDAGGVPGYRVVLFILCKGLVLENCLVIPFVVCTVCLDSVLDTLICSRAMSSASLLQIFRA